METVAETLVVLCSIGISIALARLAMQEFLRMARDEAARHDHEP